MTVLNWANTVADEQNIAAIVMSRNRNHGAKLTSNSLTGIKNKGKTRRL